jgi:hypothetical protein
LEYFAAALADPGCRGFIVGGAAGVGKSRLAEECVERAAAAGFRVGRATASAAAGAVPLGAIAHLLPTGVDLTDPVAGFAAAARELADRPGRQWVLFVDDMHLLDAASAVLLRQLMDTGALLLIGTVRTGEPYGEAVAALRGGDSVYRVDPTELSPEQVEVLLQAALGRPLARRTLHELSAASGGNVLYLRELVLGALAAGNLTEDGEIWHLVDDRLPGTARLTEMIGARLAAADPAGRPVLELLALCEPLPLTYAEAPDTPPQNFGFNTTVHSWSVVALRPSAPTDFDFTMYDDRAQTSFLKASNLNDQAVDFVAIDSNLRPLGDYYPRVDQFRGPGTFRIEHVQAFQTLQPASSSSFRFDDSNVAAVVETDLTAGVPVTIRLTEASVISTASLFIMGDDPSTPATFVQNRSSAVASAVADPIFGGPVSVTFTPTRTGRYGVVVTGDNGGGDFTLTRS